MITSKMPMQIKVETKPWKIELPSRNIEIELTTVQSNYHVEMNPSDVGNQDRHIVQEVIKVSTIPRPFLMCQDPASFALCHASSLRCMLFRFTP